MEMEKNVVSQFQRSYSNYEDKSFLKLVSQYFFGGIDNGSSLSQTWDK